MSPFPALLALLLAAAASAETTPVVTNGDWKGFSRVAEGWEGRDFDDANWDAAEVSEGPSRSGEHYTIGNLFSIESGAKWIWSGRGQETWLRRHVQAPQGFRRAEMIYIADDAVELYVNGRLADLYDTKTGGWGMRGCGVVLDLLPWLDDGDNVIAVHVVNHGGSCGFAAEVRVDGEPLVAPVSAGEELTEAVKTEIRRLAPKLDDEDADVREETTRALVKLTREHGKRVGEELAAAWPEPPPEVKGRIVRVREAAITDTSPTVEDDPRFGFGELDMDGMGRLFGADAAVQRNGIRSTVWLRVRLGKEHDAMTALLRKTAKDGSDVAAERVARLVGALAFAPEAESLAEILRTRPSTRAGAFAAAGLARIGGEDQLEALRAAAKCGFPETERAVKRALKILVK